LNPVYTIGFQIAEAIQLHIKNPGNIEDRVVELLKLVGIRDAEKRIKAYPHELSGGMQQRVMIAMALASEPELLIADEPTTALDVTIQKQIMDLLMELKEKLSMSIILITHNFGIVNGFADEVLVMFRGDVVEAGTAKEVLQNPQHNYTKALLSCIPRLNQKQHRLITIDHASI
jgi:ABC-type dipeptide/oligopeptide/nickel transport system ATPase component